MTGRPDLHIAAERMGADDPITARRALAEWEAWHRRQRRRRLLRRLMDVPPPSSVTPDMFEDVPGPEGGHDE